MSSPLECRPTIAADEKSYASGETSATGEGVADDVPHVPGETTTSPAVSPRSPTREDVDDSSEVDLDPVDPNASELQVASPVVETAAAVPLKRAKSSLKERKKIKLSKNTNNDFDHCVQKRLTNNIENVNNVCNIIYDSTSTSDSEELSSNASEDMSDTVTDTDRNTYLIFEEYPKLLEYVKNEDLILQKINSLTKFQKRMEKLDSGNNFVELKLFMGREKRWHKTCTQLAERLHEAIILLKGVHFKNLNTLIDKSNVGISQERQLLSYTEDDNNCEDSNSENNSEEFYPTEENQQQVLDTIDLTPDSDDEKELIISSAKSIESINPSTTSDLKKLSHDPIPLPVTPIQPSCSSWKVLPPEPKLLLFHSPGPKSSKVMVLQWNYITNDNFARVKNYEIFSLKATKKSEATDSNNVTMDNWMKIGDVKCLKLPMVCAVSHCEPGNTYFFAVRAIDEYDRLGPFSNVSKATV